MLANILHFIHYWLHYERQHYELSPFSVVELPENQSRKVSPCIRHLTITVFNK